MGTANRVEDEARLILLWGEVLQSSSVGLDDDLIELGGDSLVAMTLISRIAAEFGVELDLWDLLEAGTPRNVLNAIRRLESGVPQD